MEEPMLRLYRMNSAEPAGHYEVREGTWIAEPSWPSPNVVRTEFRLGADRSLSRNGGPDGILEHTTPLDVGMASGKWCGYSKPGDAPLDKRRDDAGSLIFETEVLDAPLDIAGDGEATLNLSVDKPVAQLAVRISDVHPDGRATRVTFGVLNLTHRDSHEFPEPLEPGRVYCITVPMKHVAQRFRPGHRLRLAVSTNYFPMIWPAPEKVRLSLHTEGSILSLPLRAPIPEDDALRPFLPPEAAPPLEKEVLEEPEEYWHIIEDARSGMMEMRLAEGGGTVRINGNNLITRSQGYETYQVMPGEIGSAVGRARWHYGLERGDWKIRSETETTLTSGRDDFIVKAWIRAWEGETLVHEEEWHERIPRALV